MDSTEEFVEDEFNEFILERTLNYANNPYYDLNKCEDSENDISASELLKRNEIVIGSYKRGFIDAIQLFCR